MSGPMARRMSNPQKKWVGFGRIWLDLVGFGWIGLDSGLSAPGSKNGKQEMEFSKNWLLAGVHSRWRGRLEAVVFGYRKRDFECKRDEHYCLILYIAQGQFSSLLRARSLPSLVHAFQVSSVAPRLGDNGLGASWKCFSKQLVRSVPSERLGQEDHECPPAGFPVEMVSK